MSYDIVYDRRFIKVDNLYIPMIQIGSNNTFEISASGRKIPEKYWMKLVYDIYTKNKCLLTAEEILKIAKDLDDGELYKSRYRSFQKGEFVKYIMAGVKNAKPLEVYVKWGNQLILQIGDDIKYPKTTDELKNELIFATLADKKVSLYFSERDFKIGDVLSTRDLTEYPYVIKDSQLTNYVFYLTRIYNKQTRWDEDVNKALKFKTQEEAKKFLIRHKKDPNDYLIICYQNNQQIKL